MRRVLPGLLLGLLPGGLLHAAEPDGAVALPFRWTGPRGAASGSFRSLALPVVSEVEEAWRMEFDRVEAGPVHWDGIGYVAGRRGDRTLLVAFDLLSGLELARAGGPPLREGTGLHVWDATVHFQVGAGELRTLRFAEGGLRPGTTYRGRSTSGAWHPPRDPVVHGGAIYCRVGPALVRLDADRKSQAWLRPIPSPRAVSFRFSNLALFGDHLFLAAIDPGSGEVRLEVFRRDDGRPVASETVALAQVDAHERALEIAVRDGLVFVRSGWPLRATEGTVSGAFVEFRRSPHFAFGRTAAFSFHLPPAQLARGTVVLGDGDDGREWLLQRGDRFLHLASQERQPDLFRDAVPPTVSGDVVCFGSWAADIETRRILWRLPVKRVTRPVVPADRLVLVVDDDRTLRAFRGRGRG